MLVSVSRPYVESASRPVDLGAGLAPILPRHRVAAYGVCVGGKNRVDSPGHLTRRKRHLLQPVLVLTSGRLPLRPPMVARRLWDDMGAEAVERRIDEWLCRTW